MAWCLLKTNMFFFRKFCALFLLIFFLSGLATAVLATGRECTATGSECPEYIKANGVAEKEQCCCCYPNGTCTAPNPPTAPNQGVCFPKEVVVGRDLVKPNPIDPANPDKKIEKLLTKSIDGCNGVVCPLSTHTSVEKFIMEAVNYIFYLSIIMAPLMIIIGAAVFLTSAGNPKQAKLGTSIIQWTAIGFAIILFARGITAIIKMILVG